MELKKYQKAVIDDLTRFLTLLGETGSIPKAYESIWTEKKVIVGFGGIDNYKSSIAGVPDVCFKVPTGGGKTFIACNAIKPIFNAMPLTKSKAVVWLVPSDAILEQTLKALSNAHHPYRQKINSDFSNRVEVYSKQQLLNGQNFNPTVINQQLSIFVLSYDSFRTNKKEGRKAYQENGNLALFAKFFNDPSILLADTDETALIQVIRYLNPVVIVDESHHATSELSIKMLQNFNPSFILDLTATPKKNSNIISFVDALQLKKENMVKLPVIVYNRRSQTDVFNDAISIRNKLEIQAKTERKHTGRYIRPIVLFQAQPRGNEDNTTFDKLKQTLQDIGIPENQIAIKTANKNELRDVDLMDENCPIRYIITVNALKEGWDCPFAYVLATIANRSATVDVEQILGRILRLPNTKKNQSNVLNISYVITSSNDFHETLQRVIVGLNNAGFSEKDYRANDLDVEATAVPTSPSIQEQFFNDTDVEDIPYVDISSIREQLDTQLTDDTTTLAIENDKLFATAVQQANNYDTVLAQTESTDLDMAPLEVREKMNVFHLSNEYAEEEKTLRLPQFVVKVHLPLFSDNETALLTPEKLTEGFSLRGKDTEIDFSTLDAEIAKVDIEGSKDAIPKAWKLTGFDNQFFREWFNSQPSDRRIAHCKEIILGQLTKINAINDRDLKDYINRIIDGLNSEQLEDLQQSTYSYIAKIKKKIENLIAIHAEKNFNLWIEQGTITCQPTYSLKSTISPTKYTSTLPKSLYTAEEEMNGLEKDVVWELANLSNIKWWHRNISRTGFNINGYINAFPDIIAMTTSGKILMIEPKGDHLENTESRHKIAVGRTWERKAGDMYRYYMVFRNKDLKIDGAVQFDRFMEIVKGL